MAPCLPSSIVLSHTLVYADHPCLYFPNFVAEFGDFYLLYLDFTYKLKIKLSPLIEVSRLGEATPPVKNITFHDHYPVGLSPPLSPLPSEAITTSRRSPPSTTTRVEPMLLPPPPISFAM